MSKPAMIDPDHLLDRAHGGALAPESWQTLGAHLAACRACAFEQSVTADFERARRRGARALDAAHLDCLVEGALARADLTPRPRSEATTRAASGGRTVSTARWVAAAAVIAAAVGVFVVLGSGRSAHGDPSPAPPSDATLDAGAGAPRVGGDA